MVLLLFCCIDKAVLDRMCYQVGGVFQVERFQKVSSVVLNGSYAYGEHFCNFLTSQALGNEL
jgi:hypothetical protein